MRIEPDRREGSQVIAATAGPMLSARPESRVRAWTGSAGIHMGELWESSVVLSVAGYLS